MNLCSCKPTFVPLKCGKSIVTLRNAVYAKPLVRRCFIADPAGEITALPGSLPVLILCAFLATWKWNGCLDVLASPLTSSPRHAAYNSQNILSILAGISITRMNQKRCQYVVDKFSELEVCQNALRPRLCAGPRCGAYRSPGWIYRRV